MINLFKIIFALIMIEHCHSMDVFKINYTSDFNFKRSKLLTKVLQENYSVPAILINDEFVEDCDKQKKDALIHLCLLGKGEIKVVHIDYKFFRNVIKSFQKEEL
jgi:hypothetical protein